MNDKTSESANAPSLARGPRLDPVGEAKRSRATVVNERTIPSFLAKHGIRSVTDNLDGREVVLPPGTISLFFGKEILRALEARRLAKSTSASECPTK